MAIGDEEVGSTDTKCLIKIAANSKIMAASLSAQVEKFDKYVEEERETHRLLVHKEQVISSSALHGKFAHCHTTIGVEV